MRRGSKLQVAYFDQMRDALDLDATLADTISPGSEWVEFGGQRKHVMSYLNDFLFSPERANSPVRTLSGGERNRLLLARLFALPANVLVLDEPTNDLDIDTLELLEELLQGYTGTVFLVSHDRRFLDNVVTSTIAWEGDPAFGGSRACGASTKAASRGLADCSARAARVALRPRRRAAPAAPAPPPRRSRPAPRSKLSYKEQRELDGAAGAHRGARGRAEGASPRPWPTPRCTPSEPQRATELHARYAQIDEELLAALERWEALGAALNARGSATGKLPNQLSLVATGCVRLTISPPCRYSALSRRIARPRFRPGHSRHLAQVGAFAVQAVHGGLHHAGQHHVAQVHAQGDAVGGRAGDLGQQLLARAAHRQLPQHGAQRLVQVRLADQRGLAGRPAGAARAGSTRSTRSSDRRWARNSCIGSGQCASRSVGNTVSGTTRGPHCR